MHFVGEDSQKGLLSFKNNMLITTHHTAAWTCWCREQMPDSEGFPRTLPSWGPRVTENLRCSQGLQVAEMWTRRSCALQSPYYFCHLSPQWLQLLNIHEVKWSSSRAQGLLGYLLLGCTRWKKSNKSGIIHILKHMGPKTWLKRQSGPEPLQAPVRNLKFPK